MSNPNADRRSEFPLVGGGTFVLMTGKKSLFEEITNELLERAKRILALMKQHVADDYANEEFRRKWAVPPIPGLEGDLLTALLWVIAHERERLFAELTKHETETGHRADRQQ
jgi:hypothetical protein